MADKDIASIFFSVIERQMEDQKEIVLSGKIEDYPRYRYLIGKLRALEAVEAEVKEAFRKRFDDEEE